jgi:hypothetical protein
LAEGSMQQPVLVVQAAKPEQPVRREEWISFQPYYCSPSDYFLFDLVYDILRFMRRGVALY